MKPTVSTPSEWCVEAAVSDMWHVVNHLRNDLCFFQRWLKGWCWKEFLTSLKTPASIVLRWVPYKYEYMPACIVWLLTFFRLSLNIFPPHFPTPSLPSSHSFPLLLQVSWTNGLVVSVVRTQQEVAELLTQVRTNISTHEWKWARVTFRHFLLHSKTNMCLKVSRR